MLANIAFGVVAVIGGIIALRNMDRIDRRKTFMIGLSLTTTCHCLVGVASMLLPAGNPARPYVILVLVVGVRAVDADLPQHRRVGVAGGGLPTAHAWSRASAWRSSSAGSPTDSSGCTSRPWSRVSASPGRSSCSPAIGVVALLFVYTQVPETRGRSLEALEEDVTTGQIYVGMR